MKFLKLKLEWKKWSQNEEEVRGHLVVVVADDGIELHSRVCGCSRSQKSRKSDTPNLNDVETRSKIGEGVSS